MTKTGLGHAGQKSATGKFSPQTTHLLEVLGERPIAYHAIFARVFGIKAAIMLGQLLYWHGRQADPDGWIRKTSDEMEDETALSERSQEGARSALIAKSAIEYKRRGAPAMPHYRLNHEAILDAVLSYLDSAKRPNQLGQNVLTSWDVYRGNLIGQNVLSITETTTESTTETTAEREGAARPPRARAAPRPSVTAPASIRGQPPPNARRPKWQGPLSDDPRVTTYIALTQYTPNKVQTDAILAEVQDLALWERTIRERQGYGCSVSNVCGNDRSALADYKRGGPQSFGTATNRARSAGVPPADSNIAKIARIVGQEVLDGIGE